MNDDNNNDDDNNGTNNWKSKKRNDPETSPGQGGIRGVLGSSRLIYYTACYGVYPVYETGTSKYVADAPLTWTRFWIIFSFIFRMSVRSPIKNHRHFVVLPVSLSETGKIVYTRYGCMLEHVPGFHMQGVFFKGGVGAEGADSSRSGWARRRASPPHSQRPPP